MDHVVSPEDVEPVELVVLADDEPEVDIDAQLCAIADCDITVADESFTCTDCHHEFCGDHVVLCAHCDEHACDNCSTSHDGQAYCTYCHGNITHCVACETTLNTESDDTKYCDSHDAYVCSSCYAGDDKCHGCAESNHNATMGACDSAPWEARGVHDAHLGYAEDGHGNFAPFDALTLWGVDASLSLNQGAADFYLLDVVEHNVDCGPIAEPMLVVMAEEAKAYRKNLVAKYDPTFCGYVDMAIGGELRYHRAVGGGRHLPESRSEAWRYWKLLRDRGGVELLLETAQLFDEILGGSVGGKAWADATRLLHARLTNRITPAQWVDRVFTLQHNGGAFTNKITWNGSETGGDITSHIGPAPHQDPPDFKTQTNYASGDARALFADWWPAANKNRMRWRRKQWLNLTPASIKESSLRFQWFVAFVNRAWVSKENRAHKILQWEADPQTAASRFAAFYAMRHLSQDFGVSLDWTELDKYLARRVVHHTLDHGYTKINPPNMGRNFPEFLRLMCERVMTCWPTQDKQAAAFEYLDQRGFIVPMEYRTAAGMSLQLEPF